jgi:hypothetical protein
MNHSAPGDSGQLARGSVRLQPLGSSMFFRLS